MFLLPFVKFGLVSSFSVIRFQQGLWMVCASWLLLSEQRSSVFGCLSCWVFQSGSLLCYNQLYLFLAYLELP